LWHNIYKGKGDVTMKYCTLCERKVDPVKAKFSWLFFIICFGVFYLPYHWFFKKKNRCPICQTKKLDKYSPEEIEAKREKKEHKAEERKEFINNTVEKIKDIASE